MHFIKHPSHLCSNRTHPAEKIPSFKGTRLEHLHCRAHTAEEKRKDNADFCGNQDSVLTSSNISEAMCKVSCLLTKYKANK